MLEKEFKYFKEHQTELYAKYPNRYLVIKDCKVVFAESAFEAALQKAVQAGFELGTFLVQLCGKGKESYTQTFHSRVIFA